MVERVLKNILPELRSGPAKYSFSYNKMAGLLLRCSLCRCCCNWEIAFSWSQDLTNCKQDRDHQQSGGQNHIRWGTFVRLYGSSLVISVRGKCKYTSFEEGRRWGVSLYSLDQHDRRKSQVKTLPFLLPFVPQVEGIYRVQPSLLSLMNLSSTAAAAEKKFCPCADGTMAANTYLQWQIQHCNKHLAFQHHQIWQCI